MREQPDIHARLMSQYPQGALPLLLGPTMALIDGRQFIFPVVPEWYYACVFGMSLQPLFSVTRVH